MGATKNKVYFVVDGNPTDADHALAMEIRLKEKIPVTMMNGAKIGDDIPTDCKAIVCNPKFKDLVPKFAAKGIGEYGPAPAQPAPEPEPEKPAEPEAKADEPEKAAPKKRGGRAKPKKIEETGDDAPKSDDGGE